MAAKLSAIAWRSDKFRLSEAGAMGDADQRTGVVEHPPAEAER
jgi:hypothetical protein